MSYIFPSDQDRGDDELLNEACERIEELMDQLASRQALEGEPVAYEYQWAGNDRIKAVCKPEHLPTSGDDLIITPLYTHPASAVPDAEYIRALQDACDIIQADANTEQNYGSLCWIGSVLAKLKANAQEQGQ